MFKSGCPHTVIDKQMALMVQYASHLLDKVQGVMIKQLEMGETVLKGVTMKVLAKLHEVWCLGTLEMWGEESMWVLVFSEELDTLERDVIKDGLMALIKSIMTMCGSEVVQFVVGRETEHKETRKPRETPRFSCKEEGSRSRTFYIYI